MFQNWLWSFLFWFPVAAVFVVAVIFLSRRLWRELPYFLVFLASTLLVAGLRNSLLPHLAPWPRFYTFWISDLATNVVALLAMYEVFLRRLFAGFHQNRFYRKLFPIVAMMILILTVLTALQAHDKGAAFLMASRAFDFARTAVLIFFIALVLFMGRAWTRYDLGITLGFAIQAAFALASAAVRAQVHYKTTILDTIEIVSYNLSCLIWLITFWKPEVRTQFLEPGQLDPDILRQARTWETQLKKWLTGKEH